jgi:hypothetical protein
MKRARATRPWIILVSIFISITGGCASGLHPTPATDEETAQGPLAFLRDGSSSKEEVILKLGAPAAVFESERILTYRLRHTREEGMKVMAKEAHAYETWDSVQYSLVLVFDAQQVLQKHSLVTVK